MSTVAVFRRRRPCTDATPAMYEMVSEIERLVHKSCQLRQALQGCHDKRLSACALDDMIDVLDEVKLRLRIDASGHLRT
jgi:hypothetical protein